MPSVISGVATSAGRDQFAKAGAGLITSVPTYFVVGEGGYILLGGVKTPKTPDITKTRIDSQGTLLSGTFTWTPGSSTVTGSGVNFSADGLVAGKWVRPDAQVDGNWYQVLSVSGSTITLVSSYAGGSILSGVASAQNFEPQLNFKKVFSGSDIAFQGTGTATIRANTVVGFTEANTNQPGGSPEFFEIGLFDNNGVLVAYGTFPGEVKTSAKTLSNVLNLIF